MKSFSTFLLCFIIANVFVSCDSMLKKDKRLGIETQTVNSARFVGSEKCKDCHQKEYSEWMGSHHQLAMQIADSGSVLGDFNDVHFISKGINYHFYRKGHDFMVNTEGNDGTYQDFKIKYTFGISPLQQYIIEFDKGNEQCLLVAWDAKSLKWFDLQPKLEIHHSEWMHWTGGSMTWNNMCADCHSTYLEKNYNPENSSYNTTFTEINVGCEACHGPSDQHVEYYVNKSKYKDSNPPVLYMHNKMSSKEVVQKCARCHSRRSMVSNGFDYKGHYLDNYYPNLIRYPTYERDGQILDEDYVYGSFMQSKMYHYGISCKDCHDMHTLKLKKDGNNLCLSCHEPEYNSFQHHFHKENSEASQCINCHMTGRIYMGIDFRRDHSFRVPRPDQTMKYGTPNACNKCHKDKSAKWASEFIIEKYGTKRPKHFSDWLLPGLEGNVDSLKNLVKQNDFPELIRATATNVLGERLQTNKDVEFIVEMLNDSSAMVRREAILSLVNLGKGFSKEVENNLSDSIRTVRIAAARYFILNNLITQNLGFEKAKQEFLTDLNVNSDFASGQFQLALYYTSLGNRVGAKNAYKKALKIDNYYNMARMNLALMEYEDSNVKIAEQLYLKVIEQEADYSYPYFMLGLLYNEQNFPDKSLLYLDLSCQKKPFILKAHYNYALKLQQMGNYKKADKILNQVLKRTPNDESVLYIKMLGNIKENKYKEAEQICHVLIKIAPHKPEYKKILNDIKQNFN